MSGVMFDTHRMVKQLLAAGFTDLQAESVTDVVAAARQFDVDVLATKTDLAALRHELRQEIAETKSEILRWVTGLAIAQTGLVVALVKLLPGH